MGTKSVSMGVCLCVLLLAASLSLADGPSLNTAQPAPSPKSENPEMPSPQNGTPGLSVSEQKQKAAEGQTSENPTDYERFMTGKLPYSVSTDVRQFGYDLFAAPPSTFAPVETVPVGPEYVLGPGDEMRVSIWGMINNDFGIQIDTEGKAVLPQIGILQLSGLTFKEAKELIAQEFYRFYRQDGVKISISMGKLRTIRVFIVGKVAKPGSYTVSSLATIINALFASGGPSKIGTMRDIQLKRNGKTTVHFDLYDFLLFGDKTKDVKLMPEDVIFVPPVGPLVLIAGEVKAPGIYELKGETKIKGLIAMAGGLNATGYLQKVQVERIYENEVRSILDANLKDLTDAEDVPLTDGAVVKIYPISNVVVNAVNLAGSVVRPGQYQWSEGMRVSDLFNEPENDLMPETCYSHALIERLTPPDYHKEIISFDLGKALFEKDEAEDKPLRPYDVVTVYSKWDFSERPMVRITGPVNRPGVYELMPNMKVSDLLKLAGGVLYYASFQAELTRVEAVQDGPRVLRVSVDLKKAMEGDEVNDIPLRTNDFLFVRTVPEWSLYRVVNISGEVLYPGTYTIEKGETISSLIKRAGGFTDKAYLKGSVFTRESVRAAQQKHLDEIIARLEQEMLMQPLGATEPATEKAEQKQAVADERRRAFIAKLKTLKSQGRITIRLAQLGEFTGGPGDVELEEGDTLVIPREPSCVNVTGSVYNQAAFIYQPGGTVESYISWAGGMTKDADKGSIYVLKVDGSASSRSSGSGFLGYDKETHSWMSGFMNRKLDPGDTVVVPVNIEKVDWLSEVKDLTTMLFQAAISAGVVIAAF